MKIAQIEKEDFQNLRITKIFNFIENLLEFFFSKKFHNEALICKLFCSLLQNDKIISLENKLLFLCRFVDIHFERWKSISNDDSLITGVKNQIEKVINLNIEEIEKDLTLFLTKKRLLQENYQKLGRMDLIIIQSLENIKSKFQNVIHSTKLSFKKSF